MSRFILVKKSSWGSAFSGGFLEYEVSLQTDLKDLLKSTNPHLMAVYNRDGVEAALESLYQIKGQKMALPGHAPLGELALIQEQYRTAKNEAYKQISVSESEIEEMKLDPMIKLLHDKIQIQELDEAPKRHFFADILEMVYEFIHQQHEPNELYFTTYEDDFINHHLLTFLEGRIIDRQDTLSDGLMNSHVSSTNMKTMTTMTTMIAYSVMTTLAFSYLSYVAPVASEAASKTVFNTFRLLGASNTTAGYAGALLPPSITMSAGAKKVYDCSRGVFDTCVKSENEPSLRRIVSLAENSSTAEANICDRTEPERARVYRYNSSDVIGSNPRFNTAQLDTVEPSLKKEILCRILLHHNIMYPRKDVSRGGLINIPRHSQRTRNARNARNARKTTQTGRRPRRARSGRRARRAERLPKTRRAHQITPRSLLAAKQRKTT